MALFKKNHSVFSHDIYHVEFRNQSLANIDNENSVAAAEGTLTDLTKECNVIERLIALNVIVAGFVMEIED